MEARIHFDQHQHAQFQQQTQYRDQGPRTAARLPTIVAVPGAAPVSLPSQSPAPSQAERAIALANLAHTHARAHDLRSRRRTSLPSSTQADARHTAAAARPQTYLHPPPSRAQAASPEVISSLIDQLSALSVPAHNHFENLLAGYDAGQPSPTSLSVHSASARNSGLHNNAIAAVYNAIKEQTDLYSDEACEPPVVRTSKPPSGFSALTAPKKRDRQSAPSSYVGKSASSTASLHSLHSLHSSPSVSSFGTISVEAGGPKQGQGGSNRSSVESKRSAKGHRLMYVSSRERLRLKDVERKRATSYGPEDTSPVSPRKATQLFSYEDTISEEPPSREGNRLSVADSAVSTQRLSTHSHSSRRLRLNLVDRPRSESPLEQGLIPERRSSLNHSSPPRRKKSKREKSGRQDRVLPPAVLEPVGVAMDEDAVRQEQILQELEKEENEVAQRIRELKEQKLRRDRLAEKATVVDSLTAGQQTPGPAPHVSRSPSPKLSPASSASSIAGQRVQSSIKAHRVLGIANEDLSTDPRPDPSIAVLDPAERAGNMSTSAHHASPITVARHARHRSMTANDALELTPLPIDYALAVKRLEEATPISPTSNSRASKASPPPSINVSVSGSTHSSLSAKKASIAVGGRSAVGRKATITRLKTPNQRHSTMPDMRSGLSPPQRAASEEISSRHKSMHVTSSPSSQGSVPQRRRTLTKKRWSHPDQPTESELDGKDGINPSRASASGAVQKPVQPTVEERPASRDSIDMDVEKYLNSPRLSREIRHPQTGRLISFSDVGDPHGHAVFVCVGMGLTRYVMAFYDQLAATLNLRLITPDRPGIGGSEVDPNGTPLSWPDDVLVICQHLKITKFSLLAHSAGAVYALAASLRMPQHIRGRVHLLAPWIPPSQMAPIGLNQDSAPAHQLPRSQRFLRALPPSLLKVANSTFLSATSASLQRAGPKTAPRTRRKSLHPQPVGEQRPSLKDSARESMMTMDQVLPTTSNLTLASPTHNTNNAHPSINNSSTHRPTSPDPERLAAYDERLTFSIWDRATTAANPATDLIVCLETRQPIGFRYEDISRPVVIHHGSKDSRVPVDNVRWLGKLMRRCEVRILEGEQHGLMASAAVMANVLAEIGGDWADWMAVTGMAKGKGEGVGARGDGGGSVGGRGLGRRRTADGLRGSV